MADRKMGSQSGQGRQGQRQEGRGDRQENRGQKSDANRDRSGSSGQDRR